MCKRWNWATEIFKQLSCDELLERNFAWGIERTCTTREGCRVVDKAKWLYFIIYWINDEEYRIDFLLGNDKKSI